MMIGLQVWVWIRKKNDLRHYFNAPLHRQSLRRQRPRARRLTNPFSRRYDVQVRWLERKGARF